MTEDHANMPGMDHQTKQPEPRRADPAPQKAQRPEKSDKATDTKPAAIPKKS